MSGMRSMMQVEKDQIYWLNASGKYHREDGPAFIWWTDKLYGEEWFLDGVPTRVGGPPCTTVYYRGTLQLCRREYRNSLGELDSRVAPFDGPALQKWNSDGLETYTGYFECGIPHRRGNKPAIILRYPNGNICHEFWKDGKVERDEKGCAKIIWFSDN